MRACACPCACSAKSPLPPFLPPSSLAMAHLRDRCSFDNRQVCAQASTATCSGAQTRASKQEGGQALLPHLSPSLSPSLSLSLFFPLWRARDYFGPTFRRRNLALAASARQFSGARALPHLICHARQAAVVVGPCTLAEAHPRAPRSAEESFWAPQKKRGAAKKVGWWGGWWCKNGQGAGVCGSQKWFCTQRGVVISAKTVFLRKRWRAVLAQRSEKEGFHLCEDWVTRKQLGQHKHGNATLRG